jgi:hypothetical protein
MSSEAEQPAPVAQDDERLNIVIADLIKRGPSRPRKLNTLKNTVNASFQNKLSDAEASAVVALLKGRGYVTVNDTNVSYSLPT